MIDSHVFTPGPVGGLQDVPGGALKESCMGPLVESCSRPAGITFNLGHNSRDMLVYD